MKVLVPVSVVMLVVVALWTAPASAGLGVGDPAPALSIAEWVKGAPVDLSTDGKKKIHVVEFWAVWCPPCKMSVPLLSELQKKYKNDVTILGVTEPDAGQNSPAAIRDFVKSQGAQMEYTVAIDTGRTSQAYMVAAGAIGIPHAFIVGKDGLIVWQGSPLDPNMSEVLDKMVAGTYDLAAAKLEAQVTQRFDALNLFAQTGQWNKVSDGLKEILKLDPANEVALGAFVDISVQEIRDRDAFRQWLTSHINSHRSNRVAMRRLASMLFMIGDFNSRNPDLALAAAKAAYDSPGKRDAATLTTYARAVYRIGSLDKAISLQQDAVALAVADERDAVRAGLDYYRTCKKLQADLR